MTAALDHIGFSASDYEKAKAFYAAVLAPLGMTKLQEWPASVTGDADVAGFGPPGNPFFWIASGGKTTPHMHLAIRVDTRAQVDAFYEAAIAAGGKDNGGPGVREMYHPNYYAAFVLDLEGHNIEAVCHIPASVALRSTGAARKPAKKAVAKPARKAAAKAVRKASPKVAKKPAKRTAAKKPAAKKKPAKKAARRTKK